MQNYNDCSIYANKLYIIVSPWLACNASLIEKREKTMFWFVKTADGLMRDLVNKS